MVSFLFWNLNNKCITESVARLALMHQIDILMLVECSIQPFDLLNSLNSLGDSDYFFSPSECDRVKIYTKFSEGYIRPIYENDKLTIRHLNLPEKLDILLAVTHFVSKLKWHDKSQALQCPIFANHITAAEERIGHSRTILVGDLNMNPFEDGVIGANGLNAVMSRSIAKRGNRIVDKETYPYFYNPMWNLLGDATTGPPGTYYYPQSEHVAFFWHMFDQVLLRPDLIERFRVDDLKILESDGMIRFLSEKGYPNKRRFSDHLPIFFKLEI